MASNLVGISSIVGTLDDDGVTLHTVTTYQDDVSPAEKQILLDLESGHAYVDEISSAFDELDVDWDPVIAQT